MKAYLSCSKNNRCSTRRVSINFVTFLNAGLRKFSVLCMLLQTYIECSHKVYTRIQCKLFWQNKPQYIQENNGWLLDILNVNSISSIQKYRTLSCLLQRIASIPFHSPIQPEHNNINENF